MRRRSGRTYLPHIRRLDRRQRAVPHSERVRLHLRRFGNADRGIFSGNEGRIRRGPSAGIPRRRPRIAIAVRLFATILASRGFSARHRRLVEAPREQNRQVSGMGFPTQPQQMVDRAGNHRRVPADGMAPHFYTRQQPAGNRGPAIAVRGDRRHHLRAACRRVRSRTGLRRRGHVLRVAGRVLRPVVLRHIELACLRHLFRGRIGMRLCAVTQPGEREVRARREQVVAQSSGLPARAVSGCARRPQTVARPDHRQTRQFRQTVRRDPRIGRSATAEAVPYGDSHHAGKPR